MRKATAEQMGPITVMETARAHGITREEADDIARAVDVDPNRWPFTYMTRSDANRFLKELYRRKGIKVGKRQKALKTGAPALDGDDA